MAAQTRTSLAVKVHNQLLAKLATIPISLAKQLAVVLQHNLHLVMHRLKLHLVVQP